MIRTGEREEMYNLSISFGTADAETTVLNATTAHLGVLVTDTATGAPITGLEQGQFTIYVWAPFKGYQEQTIAAFTELARGGALSSLPGVYSILVNWSTTAPGSNSFAVAVTAIPLPRVKGAPPPPVTVLGTGVGTYISLTGLS
jgi:hypothetical protein